jgi:hypothetical protein
LVLSPLRKEFWDWEPEKAGDEIGDVCVSLGISLTQIVSDGWHDEEKEVESAEGPAEETHKGIS